MKRLLQVLFDQKVSYLWNGVTLELHSGFIPAEFFELVKGNYATMWIEGGFLYMVPKDDFLEQATLTEIPRG